jgi:hypothetical protein
MERRPGKMLCSGFVKYFSTTLLIPRQYKLKKNVKNFLPIMMSIDNVEKWRKTVMRNNAALTDAHLPKTQSALNKCGVIVFPVLKEAEVDNLRTLELITYLTTELKPRTRIQRPQVNVAEISGGVRQTTIRVHDIMTNNLLAISRKYLSMLTNKIQKVIGTDYHLGREISYVESPLNVITTHQVIHADSVRGDRYHGLLVLSQNCTPTEFYRYKDLPAALDDNNFRVCQDTGKLVEESVQEKVRNHFSPMLIEPVSELESKLSPVSATCLPVGSVVLFRSDVLHRGPAVSGQEERILLFFTMERGNDHYDSNYQLHAGLLGELLYGRRSEECFRLVQAHENGNAVVQPSLRNHLDPITKAQYEEFVGLPL